MEMSTTFVITGCFLFFYNFAGGWLTNPIVVILLLAVFFVGSLIMNQESMLYVPTIQGIKTTQQNPKGLRVPSERGLRYEEVWLRVPGEDGLQLHAWFLPAPTGSERSETTVLFCHENAGNIGMRLQEFRYVHYELGVNQLVFDYRGYGSSIGPQTPSEAGLIADARAALDWLHARAEEGKLDANKIVLCGRSLGGAVAVQLASQLCMQKGGPGVAALIIENSFTSVEDMVDCMFPFFKPLGGLKKWFLRLSWRSIDVIGDITLPTLFLSADKDEIVPNTHMHALEGAATSTSFKEMHTFKDATHNDIWERGGEAYWRAKRKFLDRVLGHGVTTHKTTQDTAQAAGSEERVGPVVVMKTDLAEMQGTELKRLAQQCGVNIRGCSERAEIVAAFEAQEEGSSKYTLS